MRSTYTIAITSSVVTFFVIIIIALFIVFSENTGGPKDFAAYIIDQVNPRIINETLKNVTTYPHWSTSSGDSKVTNFIRDQWLSHGLENVILMSYEVLLSLPHVTKQNYIRLACPNGTVVFESTPMQPEVNIGQEDWKNVLPAYNGFSPSANLTVYEIVYANYGNDEDFAVLRNFSISLQGKIVLMRYGKRFRGDKVRAVEAQGALGVIFFSDPEDVAPDGSHETYPRAIYAPPYSVELGTLKLEGDLQTPHYPSISSAFKVPLDKINVPGISAQPISYADAYEILRRMEGTVAPLSFQGGLNLTYVLGPDIKDGCALQMDITNVLTTRKKINNVMAMIEGEEEPDRYVLLGSHRDAWAYGGIDPSSSTAALLEVTRIFGKMVQDEDWRPRRSLVFASWSAGEHGNIGSTEFVEEMLNILEDRTVAYINCDKVMTGNFSFYSRSMPLLYRVIEEVSKTVPNFEPSEVKEGRKRLYDTWAATFPSEIHPERPHHGGLGAGGDYSPFLFSAGIPSADFVFRGEETEPAIPLCHTAYDTYQAVTMFADPNLMVHSSLARLVDEALLPFDVNSMAEFVNVSFIQLENEYGSHLHDLEVDMFHLSNATETFCKALKMLPRALQEVDLNHPIRLRAANDAVMLMTKAFINPRGLPDRPLTYNTLLGPSTVNSYEWDAFPGIYDLLRREKELGDEIKQKLQQHVAELSFRFYQSANIVNRAVSSNLF